MEMQLHAAVYSHAGNVRPNNEDNFLLLDSYRKDVTINTTRESKACPAQHCVFAVCDGMGGESAGEEASLTAVEGLKPCILDRVREQVTQQVLQINDTICNEIKKRNGTRMGSTVAALYIDKNTAVCCNLGDSRVYLLREGHLRQMSKDHNEAQRMMDMGVMSTETARKSSIKHRLTQHLGIFSDEFVIEPFISENIELQDNDLFLLCSDGLTDMLGDKEIKEILEQELDPKSTSETLVNAALNNGGIDNVTALVIQVSNGAMDQQGSQNKVKKQRTALLITSVVLCLAAIAGIAFGLYTLSFKTAQEPEQGSIANETVGSDDLEEGLASEEEGIL